MLLLTFNWENLFFSNLIIVVFKYCLEIRLSFREKLPFLNERSSHVISPPRKKSAYFWFFDFFDLCEG